MDSELLSFTWFIGILIAIVYITYIIITINDLPVKKNSLQDAINQIEKEKLLTQIKTLILQENYVEAFPILEQASALGSAEAMYILGEFHTEGKHIEKNLSKALEYYNKASEKKYPKALYKLGMFYLKGEIVDKDLVKAEKLIEESARYGDKKALEILNKMLGK